MAHVRVVMDESGLDELDAYVFERVTVPVTEDVARDMRRFVPVLSGDLKATIRVEFHGWEGRVYFGDVAGIHGRGVIVDYHFYQEFGTSKMGAQPYARPALYMERVL